MMSKQLQQTLQKLKENKNNEDAIEEQYKQERIKANLQIQKDKIEKRLKNDQQIYQKYNQQKKKQIKRKRISQMVQRGEPIIFAEKQRYNTQQIQKNEQFNNDIILKEYEQLEENANGDNENFHDQEIKEFIQNESDCSDDYSDTNSEIEKIKSQHSSNSKAIEKNIQQEEQQYSIKTQDEPLNEPDSQIQSQQDQNQLNNQIELENVKDQENNDEKSQKINQQVQVQKEQEQVQEEQQQQVQEQQQQQVQEQQQQQVQQEEHQQEEHQQEQVKQEQVKQEQEQVKQEQVKQEQVIEEQQEQNVLENLEQIEQQQFDQQQQIDQAIEQEEQIQSIGFTKKKSKKSSILKKNTNQNNEQQVTKGVSFDITPKREEYTNQQVAILQKSLKMLTQIKKFKKIKNQFINRFIIIIQIRIHQRTSRFRTQIFTIIIKDKFIIFIKANEFIPDLINNGFQNQIEYLQNQMQGLCNFHQEFYSKLKEQFQNYKPYNQFFSNLVQTVNFFKIYFDYCQEYDNFNELFQNEKIMNICFEHNLDDCLYKPIQRLPQYVMLLKQTLKDTKIDHCDYPGLHQVYTIFSNINRQNDMQMQSYHNQYELKKLQKLFPTISITKQDSKIQRYIFEEQLDLIEADISHSVSCVFFDSLMIFYKIIKTLSFDNQSYIKPIKNKKYFKNLFMINGVEETLIFSQKEDIIDQIKDKILESKNVIKIDVIASITRPEKSKSGYFVNYVVEIELGDFIQRIFLRHSQLEKIENLAQRLNIQIKKLSKPHFNLSNTKLVEARKMMIQATIQQIFSKNQNVEKFQEMLDFLNVDKTFYYQTCEPLEYRYIMGYNISYFMKLLYKTQQVNIQNDLTFTYEITVNLPMKKSIIVKANHLTRVQDILDDFSIQLNINYFVDFSVILKSEPLCFILDKDEMISDYKDQKEQKSFFKMFTNQIDFSIKKLKILPLKYEKAEFLDNIEKLNFYIEQILDDLQLYQIYQYSEYEIIIIFTLYLYSKYEFIINIDNKQFSQEIEKLTQQKLLQKISQKNLIQHIKECWELLARQILSTDSKRKSVYLGGNSLDLFLNEKPEVSKSFTLNKSKKDYDQFRQTEGHKVKNNAADEIENQKFSIYLSKFSFLDYIKNYADQIPEFSAGKRRCSQFDQIKQQKDKTFVEKNKKRQYISLFIIIQICEQKNLYGCQFYPVNVYKKITKKNSQYLHQKLLPDNIILGVKWSGILLLDQNYNEIGDKIDYFDISNISYEPKSIFIDVQKKDFQTNYRFDTFYNWEISTIIEKYKKINEHIL